MYGVSTPSDAPIIFPASYTLTLFGLVVVSVCCPSASVWPSRRPKPSRSIRLVLSSANTRLVNSFVVVVMILLVRHIAEVQREHPAVTVDDILRQTGQRDKRNADGCRWRLPPPPVGRGYCLRPNRLLRPPKAQNAALSNRPAKQ